MDSQRQSSDSEAKSESKPHVGSDVVPGMESAALVPSVHQSVVAGGRLPSRAQAIALQRTAGNRATARLLSPQFHKRSLAVQRHAPGAPLLGGLGAADSGSIPTLSMGDIRSDDEDAGTGTPATPTTTPPTAAPTPAADGGTTATPEADVGTTGPVPATLTMPTLQTAFAQEALQTSFGDVAPASIITGNITIVADSAALYAVYDNWMIANSRTNRDTGVAWVAGDKARWNARRNIRTNAFAEPDPSTNIFIDATQTDPTATVHEMLHVNTAPGFTLAVGRAINEGITQRFATQAILASGNAVTGSERTYQQEQRVVTHLILVVGEPVVRQAYFNGANTLIDAYNSVMGADTFALLKATLAPDSQAGYDAAVEMLVPPSLTQKISSINAILDGWWVSGDDLTMIERIVSTCSDSDKMEIWMRISPRVDELWFESKRVRLRGILGVGMPAVNDQPQGDSVLV